MDKEKQTAKTNGLCNILFISVNHKSSITYLYTVLTPRITTKKTLYVKCKTLIYQQSNYRDNDIGIPHSTCKPSLIMIVDYNAEREMNSFFHETVDDEYNNKQINATIHGNNSNYRMCILWGPRTPYFHQRIIISYYNWKPPFYFQTIREKIIENIFFNFSVNE